MLILPGALLADAAPHLMQGRPSWIFFGQKVEKVDLWEQPLVAVAVVCACASLGLAPGLGSPLGRDSSIPEILENETFSPSGARGPVQLSGVPAWIFPWERMEGVPGGFRWDR